MVITDGFTGNVIIKLSEGVASLIVQGLREQLMRTLRTKLGALLAKLALPLPRRWTMPSTAARCCWG